MKRLIAIFLSITTMLCSITFIYATEDKYAIQNEDYIPRNMKYATREEAISEFVKAIELSTPADGVSILKKFSDSGKISSAHRREIAAAVSNEMVSGYSDGTFRPQEFITRAEALVILKRILSVRTLPEILSVSFTDTPQWAEDEITSLASAGIIKGYGDGTFGASDLLTTEQVNILVNRAIRFMGPTGNFYEYANEEWINETDLAPGQNYWSATHEITSQVMKETGGIIYNLAMQKSKGETVFEKGSSQQKIADMFSVAGNSAYRDSLGLEPAKVFLDQIDSCTNINQLIDVMAILEYNGFHGLLPISVSSDAYNSNRYLPTFSEVYTGMNNPLVQNPDTSNKVTTAYNNYLKKLFALFGYINPQARANHVTDLCKALAISSMPVADHNNIEANYDIYTLAAASTNVFTNVDIKKYLSHFGINSVNEILIYDLSLAQKANSYIVYNNLELIKDYLRAAVMDGCSIYLNSDAFAVWKEYQDELNGIESNVYMTDYAINTVEELLSWDLAKLYVEKYSSPDAKSSVENITYQILDAYKDQIKNNSWMSDFCRTAALKKLDAIRVKVGYPENIEEYTNSNYNIASQKDGGNLIKYRSDYCKIYFNTAAKYLNTETVPDKNDWSMLPQTVNAMYDIATNSIIIPLAMLRDPFYNPKNSYEANLGGIGAVISHEISHALDSLGSKFDENGNLKNWWLESDRIAFEKICSQVTNAYNKIEVLPNKYINGEQTLGENLADIAGMSCILSIAENNYLELDELFISYANTWRMKATDKHTETILATDTHAPDDVRVNRVLSNFQLFSNYYEIKEGDGMYLPRDERIKIWNK